ncbi:MAG: type II toxin-antitoxin system VapC family toxin [Campylobacterales bacterium]|nr:type II toxin-antitoxin system VapC family toxin [Campylobacterales bacterium]
MRVFLDANIILDAFDPNRPHSKYSREAYFYILSSHQVFTSCDLITTIYYVHSKIDKVQALTKIAQVNKTLKVIEFSNKEVEQTCQLMIDDKDYKDLEDTIQYIMAKKENCDLILSNDKNFVSKDIKLLSSEEFCKQRGINI